MSDFHFSSWQTARKDHMCSCLTGPIRDHRYRRHHIHRGDRYERIFGKFDGNPYSHQLCRLHSAECSAAFDNMDWPEDERGLDYERVREWWGDFVGNCMTRKDGLQAMLKSVREQLRSSRGK